METLPEISRYMALSRAPSLMMTSPGDWCVSCSSATENAALRRPGNRIINCIEKFEVSAARWVRRSAMELGKTLKRQRILKRCASSCSSIMWCLALRAIRDPTGSACKSRHAMMPGEPRGDEDCFMVNSDWRLCRKGLVPLLPRQARHTNCQQRQLSWEREVLPQDPALSGIFRNQGKEKAGGG